MSGLGIDVGNEAATCKSCDTQLWVGDRFCRRCGELADPTADAVHEIDLASTDTQPDHGAGQGGWRRLRLLLGLLVAVAAVAVVLALVGGSNDDSVDDATSPDNAFPETRLPGDGLPGAGPTGDGLFANENPPERQAALDAFEAARARNNVSVADVLDIFDVDADLLAIDRNKILRFDRFGRRDVEALSPQRLPNEWPYGLLGHADAVGYRINSTARSIIDVWDSEFERWSPATLTLADRTSAAIPFTALAVSPTHVAAEAGGRVRFWSQETEAEVGRVSGRLIPSTGGGFVISECEPADEVCALNFYNSSGEATGETLDALTFTPDFDRPARISPDGTRVAFAHDNERVIWHLDRSDLLLSRRSYGDPVSDVAWVPDGSALLMLTEAEIIVDPDGLSLIRIPVDLDGASTLTFAE